MYINKRNTMTSCRILRRSGNILVFFLSAMLTIRFTLTTRTLMPVVAGGGVYFLRSLFDVCAVCNYRRNQIGRLGFHKLNISHLRTPFHTLATLANLQTL